MFICKVNSPIKSPLAHSQVVWNAFQTIISLCKFLIVLIFNNSFANFMPTLNDRHRGSELPFDDDLPVKFRIAGEIGLAVGCHYPRKKSGHFILPRRGRGGVSTATTWPRLRISTFSPSSTQCKTAGKWCRSPRTVVVFTLYKQVTQAFICVNHVRRCVLRIDLCHVGQLALSRTILRFS